VCACLFVCSFRRGVTRSVLDCYLIAAEWRKGKEGVRRGKEKRQKRERERERERRKSGMRGGNEMESERKRGECECVSMRKWTRERE